MPEPTKTVEYKFDEKAFADKQERLINLRNSKGGQKNTNSYIWFRDVVEPSLVKYSQGNRSKELFDSFMAIKEEVPLLNPKIAVESVPQVTAPKATMATPPPKQS